MSRVIRGAGGVVPREVFDAAEEAERILEDARRRALEIVEAAHVEAERIRGEARLEGLAEGRADAAVTLAQAGAVLDRALGEAEQAIAAISVAVAERILVSEVEADPERVVAIAAEVLGRARRARDVTITVHPDDAPTLRVAQQRLLDHAAQPARFAIVEDPSITRGGCLVRTELGRVDGRIETQLRSLLDALDKFLRGGPTG